MSNNGPKKLSLHKIFPNEVILFLKALSDRQKIGVQRVSHVWSFLSSSLLDDLKTFVKREYPFAITGTLTDSAYVSLSEKKQKIYAKLARYSGFSPTDLQIEQLKALYFDKNVGGFQKDCLARLAVASGIVENDDCVSLASAVILMAQIGNLEKLKRWLEPTPEMTGKLSTIPGELKGVALQGAAEFGHSECARYLIDTYAQEISAEDKGEALQRAKNGNHKECIEYLEQHLNPIPSTYTPDQDHQNMQPYGYKNTASLNSSPNLKKKIQTTMKMKKIEKTVLLNGSAAIEGVATVMID